MLRATFLTLCAIITTYGLLRNICVDVLNRDGLLRWSERKPSGVFHNDTFQKGCESMVSLINITNVQVNILEVVPNGTTLTFPYDDPTCPTPHQLVYGGDICRIGMYVATSNNSGITLEAWLPTDWNGRFLSVGNVGLAGCIQYYDMAYGTSLGFASVGANNGHNGTDGKVFLDAPGILEDFVYRSVHTGVVTGKQLTKLFYRNDAYKSYYLGCSSGGRQGVKAAQSFPGDFDGIVAGAPAINLNRLIGWSANLVSIAGLDRHSPSFVTPGDWTLVHEEVLRQCDSLDGAKDGIIENPDLCHPVLTTLLCDSNTTDTSSCLNPSQISRITQIFSPLYTTNSTLICPRFVPGAELGGAAYVFGSGKPPGFNAWYKYAIFNDENWDSYSFSLSDILYADMVDPFGASSYSPDLSAFRSNGGKLLVYHGMEDFMITPEMTSNYYDLVALNMSLPPREMDDFFRYFRIGGLGHCTGGSGAWDIGQVSTKGADSGKSKQRRESNVLLAIVDWVEKGIAPDFIKGYSWKDKGRGDLEFTRKHCRYPARNLYTGKVGGHYDEDGWECMF